MPIRGSSSLKPLFNLWIHDERFSPLELVINSDFFPSLRVGDLVEIFHPSPQPQNDGLTVGAATARDSDDLVEERKRLILQVKSIDRNLAAKQPQLQVRILLKAPNRVLTTFEIDINFKSRGCLVRVAGTHRCPRAQSKRRLLL